MQFMLCRIRMPVGRRHVVVVELPAGRDSLNHCGTGAVSPVRGMVIRAVLPSRVTSMSRSSPTFMRIISGYVGRSMVSASRSPARSAALPGTSPWT